MVGGDFSKSVLVYNLETHKLKNAAKLNEARVASSSTIAGETLYVFGGVGSNGRLDTIEALDVSSPSSEWEIIRSKNFTARRYAVVYSLTVDRILICGGEGDDFDYLNDVLVFDTKTKMAKKVADAPVYFHNRGNNQTYIERYGVVVALV